MNHEALLDELLSRWQERQARGQDVTAADLCADCPDLLPEVRRRLDALQRMENLAASADPLVTLDARAEVLATGRERSAFAPRVAVHVSGYEVLEELGRGGMGVVFKARQTALKRLVALKMILTGPLADGEQIARFRGEAEALARLKHPNIVEIYEIGEAEGKPYLALELVEGGGLDRKLAGTPMPAREAAGLVETLARALHFAHVHGVVHRDLKPANVLLSADGQPKITDFGLAKVLEADSGVTRTGAVLGTPSYMAPEQAGGDLPAIGPRTDVYALGTTLYEALTGRPPFKGASMLDTLEQVRFAEPASPSRLQMKLPRDLATICLKCLRKAPDQRYQSALALADDLRRFLDNEPIRARPVGTIERLWRWRQRNPAVAASLLAVGLSLLAATVVSLVFGFRAEQARQDEAAHARSEAAAKQDAEQARQAAQRQLIDLSAASGLTAAKDDDHSLALLWFARAVQLAKDEPEQQELNRIRVANWLRQVCLPEGAFAVADFRPAQDHFRTLQFSPDGKYLLVVAGAGDCLVWDRLTGRLVPLPDQAAKGLAAAWQPGTGLLAVACPDQRIRCLAPPEFQAAGDEAPTTGEVAAVAFSQDGKRLAWGGSDGARVWDWDKKEYATPLLLHGGPVVTAAFSASGELLATSARDLKARVFRIAPDASEPLFPPVRHAPWESGAIQSGPDAVAPRFAADDQVLLTVSDKTLVWRSAETGKLLLSRTAPSSQDSWTAFAVSPNGAQVATAVWEGDGGLWDSQAQTQFAVVPTPRWQWFEDLAFTPDGKTLVTGGVDCMVRFWSVDERRNGDVTVSFPAITEPTPVLKVALSPNGEHLAVAAKDGTIFLWRMPQGPSTVYSAAAGRPTLPALSPDGRLVLPRSSNYRGVTQLTTRVYDAETGVAVGPELDPGGIVVDAAFSPDGALVAIAALTARTPAQRDERLFEPDGKAGNVQIWDWKSGKRLVGPIPTPGEPRGLAFRPNGRALAVVCADYHVLLIDPATGAVTHELDPGARSRPLNANLWWGNGDARFSPDGRFLVTWELATTAHVWDPDQGRLLHSLAHIGRLTDASFSPADPTLLVTAADDMARVWDLSTGKLLAQLPGTGVMRARFSPDGAELIAGSADGMLRVWDWRTGKLKEGLLLHYASGLMDFGFSADRRWLITVGTPDLQLIDWRTKTPAGPLWKTHRDIQYALSVPAGDRRVIVGGFSGALVGYDLATMTIPTSAAAEDLIRLAEAAAGRRILSEGNAVPLTSAEWLDRWQDLQRKSASLQLLAP